MKKLIVFGASGRVGQIVVREAVKRGYDVTAAVFDTDTNMFGSGVRTLQMDVHSKSDVFAAVKGHNVAISTLGSWGTVTQDILSSGMKNIIPAMEQSRMKRIISLTGADARVSRDKPSASSYVMEFILKRIAPRVFSDGEKHIALLQKSNLDWTVVRSPKMKNGAVKKYVLSNKSAKAWNMVSRDTIACAMLDLLENGQHVHGTPIIHAR